MASFASELEADVCVLGGGIAGMLVAEKLLARGVDVLMVERGEEFTHADRMRRNTHKSHLPFNADHHTSEHEPAPVGPVGRSDRYNFTPVYNLGGSTNHFFGNTPRIHREHFDLGALEGSGGADRRWPVSYAELEPYYLAAEERLAVAGSSERVPFAGRFAYPLPPHRLSPADRAAARIFGTEQVLPLPSARPSRPLADRPACCGSNRCELCPIDSKGTALNTVYPTIRERVRLRSGLLATEVRCERGAVRSVEAIDAGGGTHRLRARHFVVACNGVDSCLLLQRSPSVPRHAAVGHYYMDHSAFDLAVWLPGVDAAPGYGDSAQTGMITAFFRRLRDDLPISVFGDVKLGTLEQGGGAREDILRHALRRSVEAAARGASFRRHFIDVFRSTLHLSFLVETQPLYDNALSIRKVNAHGQALPAISKRYPDYFAECVDTVVRAIQSSEPEAVVVHRGTTAGVSHWMGATRMSEAPADGCVDRDLAYRGLANLSILSASTYPSCSSASPTLTLAALALRLGDHLLA